MYNGIKNRWAEWNEIKMRNLFWNLKQKKKNLIFFKTFFKQVFFFLNLFIFLFFIFLDEKKVLINKTQI